MDKYVKVPMDGDVIKRLQAGDYVYLTGTIYTARDAAHKRIFDTMKNGGELPLDLDGTVIYYMGPSPARVYA